LLVLCCIRLIFKTTFKQHTSSSRAPTRTGIGANGGITGDSTGLARKGRPGQRRRRRRRRGCFLATLALSYRQHRGALSTLYDQYMPPLASARPGAGSNSTAPASRAPRARTLNRKYGRLHLLKTRPGYRTRRPGPSPGGMGRRCCHPAGPCTELWRRYGALESRWGRFVCSTAASPGP
jgi:hypothetical protein